MKSSKLYIISAAARATWFLASSLRFTKGVFMNTNYCMKKIKKGAVEFCEKRRQCETVSVLSSSYNPSQKQGSYSITVLLSDEQIRAVGTFEGDHSAQYRALLAAVDMIIQFSYGCRAVIVTTVPLDFNNKDSTYFQICQSILSAAAEKHCYLELVCCKSCEKELKEAYGI